MRARSLKPSLFSNEVLGTSDPLLTILFQGLWCLADREGRLQDRPLKIRAEVFPYRGHLAGKKIEAMLQCLNDHGLVVRYESGGQRFIQVVNFLRHQRPHRNEPPSKIPKVTEKDLRPSSSKGSKGVQPCEQALRSDSGLLTPDSGLLTDRHSTSDKNTPKADTDPEGHEIGKLVALYPRRSGRANWPMAAHNVQNRIEEGASWVALQDGVSRYAAWCDATGATGTQHVMDPATFFGAADKPWAQSWELPKSKAERIEEANRDTLQAWARTGSGDAIN